MTFIFYFSYAPCKNFNLLPLLYQKFIRCFFGTSYVFHDVFFYEHIERFVVLSVGNGKR